MSYSSKLLSDAVDGLSKLPGIGKKSALRLALHMIRQEKEQSMDLYVKPLENMIEHIKFCNTCNNLSDSETCQICSERKNKADTICVVETIRDVMAIEDTNQFYGMYHVLGGVISPLDGISASDLNIDKLLERAQQENIKEIIMAISPTIEGETTIFYLSKKLAHTGVKISQLARGISFGGELEYADEVTLGRSIMTRTPYQVSEI